MSIGLHDPRLTAYALGELTGPERAEVERALEQSEALRRAVDEIRRTGEVIRAAFDQEPPIGLADEQVAAISRAAATARRPSHWWVSVAGLSAAACILLAFFLTGDWRSEVPAAPPQQVAMTTAEDGRVSGTPEPTGSPSNPVEHEESRPQVAREQTSQPPPPRRVRPAAPETARQSIGSVDSIRAIGDGKAPQTETVIPARQTKDAFEVPTPLARPAVAAAPMAPPPAPLQSAAQTVTVVASPEKLKTSKMGVSSALVGEARDLPLNGRAVVPFLIKPGVASNAVAEPRSAEPAYNTENYARVDDNPFRLVAQNPLSTFSVDVDTASYSNVRRFLNQGRLPPADAVRIEELVNYFSYDYPQPVGNHRFSITTEAAEAPWNPQHLLVRIGLKGRELGRQERPRSNLVFLVDVSGSMDEPNKLPLLVRAMKLLVDRLTSQDKVAIVVYAGSSGVALPSTPGNQKGPILEALDSLRAGGSTHGSAGIRKAYEIAADHFIKGGVNRVILATDGDFNVGTTSHGELTRLIEEQAKSGVFLSVLGFGMGNYKDSTLEALADKGNGNYGYIDTINEARKLLVDQMDATLVTIAKDVKIQVEFNPVQVSGYRLIGYENRALRDEDFNDDTKDAGEIGAGHTVTALYELVPVGAPVDAMTVDPLKYQLPTRVDTRFAHELMTVKLRYKKPDQETSSLIETPVVDEGRSFANASDDFKFAAAVAAFGMALRGSKQRGSASFSLAMELANEGLGPDRFGYRSEFLNLVRQAQQLAR